MEHPVLLRTAIDADGMIPTEPSVSSEASNQGLDCVSSAVVLDPNGYVNAGVCFQCATIVLEFCRCY